MWHSRTDGTIAWRCFCSSFSGFQWALVPFLLESHGDRIILVFALCVLRSETKPPFAADTRTPWWFQADPMQQLRARVLPPMFSPSDRRVEMGIQKQDLGCYGQLLQLLVCPLEIGTIMQDNILVLTQTGEVQKGFRISPDIRSRILVVIVSEDEVNIALSIWLLCCMFAFVLGIKPNQVTGPASRLNCSCPKPMTGAKYRITSQFHPVYFILSCPRRFLLKQSNFQLL